MFRIGCCLYDALMDRDGVLVAVMFDDSRRPDSAKPIREFSVFTGDERRLIIEAMSPRFRDELLRLGTREPHPDQHVSDLLAGCFATDLLEGS